MENGVICHFMPQKPLYSVDGIIKDNGDWGILIMHFYQFPLITFFIYDMEQPRGSPIPHTNRLQNSREAIL